MIAIYSRKSKFKEEGESIENQINMCINYASSILGLTEYEIYEDEGFSGGNINRPKFQKLMKDIKNKKFTHLICYRLDRISRNVADFSSTLEILNKNNAAFISIKEQFDTSTAMGRAMMNVSATFAQLERETIAERIRDNLRELSKTGRWLGGPAPLGYKSVEVENIDGKGKNRKKHILKLNPEEKHIIELVYDLFLQYKSFQKVSRVLESKGIYSRTGKVFSRELVKQAITNPTYCIADSKVIEYFKSRGTETYLSDSFNNVNGIMGYNRRKDNGSFAPIEEWIISIGEHEGIVNSDTWIKCQDIVAEIKKDSKANRKGTSQEALLSGLVVCSVCSSGMAPHQQVCKDYTYRYYTCNLRNKSSLRCDNDALNAYDAEDNVIENLMSLKREDMINNFEQLNKKKIKQISNKDLITELNKEIENNKKAISNLVMKMAYLDNDPMLLEPFKEQIKSITIQNEELNIRIKQIELENDDIVDTKESLDEALERLDHFQKFYGFTTDFEDRKLLIRSVVKFIVWDSKTRKLDVIPIGSDKENPRQPLLHLGGSSRSTIDLKVKTNTIKIVIQKRKKRLGLNP